MEMDMLQLKEMSPWLLPMIVVIVIWEIIWKVIALWRSARNNDLAWFICIAFINTAGILPIIYLVMNRKKKPTTD